MDVNNSDSRNIFCVSIDGSKFSDYGFDITFNELYKPGDKFIICHIFNPEKKDLPYECQAVTIHSKYQTICMGKFKSGDYDIIVKEKVNKNAHALDSLNKVATENNVSAIVLGFQGYKENKEKSELSKGIIYMIKSITIPTFIIKESCLRKNQESGGYTWVIFIEAQDSKSYDAFQQSLKFIHPNRDNVVGYSLINKFVNSNALEKDFNVLCNNAQIKKFSFNVLESTKDPIGKQLTDIINFGKDKADFAVVGHNVQKYNEIESSPTIDIIKNAQSNIFYYSKCK